MHVSKDLMWRRENEKTWNLNKALVQWFIVSSSDHCPFQCHEIWNKQLKNLNIPACPWIQNSLLGINEVPDPPEEAARSMFPFASASSRVSEKKDTDKQHQRMVLLAWENQVKNSYTGIIGSVFALTNSLTLSKIIGKHNSLVSKNIGNQRYTGIFPQKKKDTQV